MGAVEVFLAIKSQLIGDTTFFRHPENDVTRVR